MRTLRAGLVLAVMLPVPAAGQTPDSLPPGVTAAMVEQGRTLFHGAAICMSCHGQDGAGAQGIGPALNDDEWLHSDGSYDAIVQLIMQGVSSEESTSGIMMPPKGGTNLTEDQVRAVAAYVWSLRHARS